MTAKFDFSVNHEIANCYGCNWVDQGRGARRAAYHHFRKTGHSVRCEVAKVFRYGYSAQPAKKHDRVSA